MGLIAILIAFLATLFLAFGSFWAFEMEPPAVSQRESLFPIVRSNA
jgi:hypothetical protein